MTRGKCSQIFGSVLGLVIAPLMVKAAETTMQIESGIHHLGDEVVYDDLWSLAPVPEGTSWQSPGFDLPLYPADTARIVLDTVEVSYSDTVILVNGTSIGSIPTWPVFEWAVGRSLTFDPALLLPTGNTITIRAGYEPTIGNYDDFLFRNVQLAITPEPAALALFAVAGFAVVRRRRM